MKERRAFAAIGILLLVACDSRPDQWDAAVYPDRSDLSVREHIRGFRTFELCQEAAITRMNQIQVESGGDYECGYRCRPLADGSGQDLCKETRK